MEGWNWLVCGSYGTPPLLPWDLLFPQGTRACLSPEGHLLDYTLSKAFLLIFQMPVFPSETCFSMFPLRVDSLLLGFILSSSYYSQTFSAFPPLPSYPLPSPLFPLFSALTLHSGFGYLFPYLQVI